MSIMTKAADVMQPQPGGSPFISLISAFSMSSDLNLELYFYVFVGVGSLHFIHSAVFDQSHRPLLSLTKPITHSTVFDLLYHPFYRV
jgi:hypothetical protein